MRKVIVVLEEAGYISREDIRDEKGHISGWNYQVYAEPIEKEKRSSAGKKKEKPNLPKSNQVGNGQPIISYNDKRYNNSIPDVDIDKNMLSNDNNKSCDSFDIFWKMYHKGSKKNAFKAWCKLKEQQREAALDNVDSYLLYCKRSGRPLKDVSTYLNGECFNDDWLEVPDYYKVYDTDIDRIRRFKEYMVSKFPDLIYHHNPLTFEQGDRLMEEYGAAPFEEAMRRLCGRDIHQYYSIKSGVETILKEMQNDDV